MKMMEEWQICPSTNWPQTASTCTRTKVIKEKKKKTSKPIHSVSAAQVWHTYCESDRLIEVKTIKKHLYRWPRQLNTGQFYSNLGKLFLGPLNRGWDTGLTVSVRCIELEIGKILVLSLAFVKKPLRFLHLAMTGPYGSIWCHSIHSRKEQIN